MIFYVRLDPEFRVKSNSIINFPQVFDLISYSHVVFVDVFKNLEAAALEEFGIIILLNLHKLGSRGFKHLFSVQKRHVLSKHRC